MTLRLPFGLGALAGLLVMAPLAPATHAWQDAVSGGTGLIAGRVINAVTGEGVPGAQVTLRFSPNAARLPVVRQLTSGDGTFEFRDLRAGLFTLQAKAADYLAGESGKATPWDHGRGFQLREGQRLANLVVLVWPGATISGTVRDEAGEPVPQVLVHPLRGEYRSGRRFWQVVPGARLGYVQTDDRGAYRLTGLEPADYLIMTPAPGSHPNLAPARGVWHTSGFSGGARSARDAQVITLQAGESRDGVDLVVAFRPSGRFAVSGRIDAPPPLAASLTVHLVPLDLPDNLVSFGELTTVTDARGAFTFPGVAEGDYRLQTWKLPAAARDAVQYTQQTGFLGMQGGLLRVPPATVQQGAPLPPAPADPTWVADVPLTVDRPIADLVVPLRHGARITGRVVFEGGIPPPGEELLRLAVGTAPAFDRTFGVIPGGRVEADGRFATVGLPPGSYGLQIEPAVSELPWTANWRSMSIAVGGRVITGQPIEVGASDVDVTVTFGRRDRMAAAAITVRDAQGRPVPEAWVIGVPSDPALRGRGLRLAPQCLNLPSRTDASGHFTTPPLWPVCNYLWVATRDLPRNWMAPDYLDTLAAIATPARLDPGSTQTIELTLRP